LGDVAQTTFVNRIEVANGIVTLAMRHPLGAGGARLVMTAVKQLHRILSHYALCTMCIRSWATALDNEILRTAVEL